MSNVATRIESSILSRVIDPDDANLSPEAARGLLSLRFKERDIQRMQELAEKARQGELASEERDEIDSYERIGSLLGLLQSKARRSLAKYISD